MTVWRCALVLLLLPLDVLGQEVRVGKEFLVSPFVGGRQRQPAVAASPSGSFVVVWSDDDDIRFRGFSSAGVVEFGDFEVVNTYTIGLENRPAIAMDADGDFVVVWSDFDQDGYAYGIFAQRFSSAGLPVAVEFQVNSYTIDYQLDPAIAAAPDGAFVVAWESYEQDGFAFGIFAQRFSSGGVALATEFQVNSYTLYTQAYPDVAVGADGNFVIVWHSFILGVDFTCDLFAQRYSSTGTALGAELQINTPTNGQCVPKVAVNAAGDFMVSSTRFAEHGYDGVFARRFSSAGILLASEFQVNTYTDSQGFSNIAIGAHGEFVIVWESFGQDGSGGGIFARRFSSSGSPLSGEVQVNSYTSSDQQRPDVAVDADGDFVIVWEGSKRFYGSGLQVFGQRFAVPTATPTVTATGTVTPTSTPTSTPTPSVSSPQTVLYEVPALSARALAFLTLVLAAVSLVFLSRFRR